MTVPGICSAAFSAMSLQLWFYVGCAKWLQMIPRDCAMLEFFLFFLQGNIFRNANISCKSNTTDHVFMSFEETALRWTLQVNQNQINLLDCRVYRF